MYKIGIFNDSFPPTIDGVANAVVNYAGIIQASLGEAVVVTPKYPNVADDYPYEVYRYSSTNTFGWLPYRIGNPFSISGVNELRKKNLDLLHVHAPFASSVIAREINFRKKKHKIPVVFTYHTKFDIDIDRFVRAKHFRKIVRKFVLDNIKSADDVWVVSQGAGENLREFGYKGDYIVMPNGTDFKKGKAKASDIEEIHRIYRIKKDTLVFLFCGRMMWYKNLKLILDSLNLVKEAGINFKAFFLGDGNDRPSIEQYAKNLKLDCEFTGAIYDREKVRTFFSRANLFLFPSTYDTSGLVVREAAACDCPSLLVKGSCAAEGVQDEFSGLLAQETSDSCAKKIIDAVRRPEFLTTLGKNAGNYVYLSWEDSVKIAWTRYEYVIENHRKGRK